MIILNREIKGWKQLTAVNLKTWNKWKRERGKREQMRNICFMGKCCRRKMGKGKK